MFRAPAMALHSAVRGVLRQNLPKAPLGVTSRSMAHHSESDQEFDARYEAYLNRSDIDGWEIRKAMNDLAGMDLVPDPKIVIAAMKACRRVNDYALAVRFLETVEFKTAGRKDIWEYVLNQVKPTLDELGIDTKEKLGYDKPELALQSVYDIH
ncbi:cytochrome c oxidase subunit 5A, mitochondrial [Macrosteles quadrilineatus]|uniref:cytochrome c oxidase subunit 5A, mitochondrial n=1 Tax=Macrosteles quadrilineatus TaxID=74068 RepID=UPI0023E25625|nr:cytochrome c oxidase subunit 5A, mitochondrial [Macrosteles quadrilineatus]